MSWPTRVFASYEAWRAAGGPVGGVMRVDVAALDPRHGDRWPARYLEVARAGQAWYVALPALPGVQLWSPWQRAYDKDQGYHGEGWEVSGPPESLSASPSIKTDDYHGFLQNGVLTDDAEGRQYPKERSGDSTPPEVAKVPQDTALAVKKVHPEEDPMSTKTVKSKRVGKGKARVASAKVAPKAAVPAVVPTPSGDAVHQRLHDEAMAALGKRVTPDATTSEKALADLKTTRTTEREASKRARAGEVGRGARFLAGAAAGYKMGRITAHDGAHATIEHEDGTSTARAVGEYELTDPPVVDPAAVPPEAPPAPTAKLSRRAARRQRAQEAAAKEKAAKAAAAKKRVGG